jgi:predicted phosphoribosyltransferase
MNTPSNLVIFDLPELRDREQVFLDRAHAGQVLAGMLESYREKDAIVLGIPAGGVPVAAIIAVQLSLFFDVAVVSKITLPWNTEAGYGAVAFDGTIKLNDNMLSYLGLSRKDIQNGISKTKSKVQHRVKKLRKKRPFPNLKNCSTILVDDGLASGFTIRVAIEALKNAGATQIIVAVPTGHDRAVRTIADQVEAVYCPNIRKGWQFAVASAYQRWTDVDESEVMQILQASTT